MENWQKQALECAPELKQDFEAAVLSPYSVFTELLAIVHLAHKNGDTERLRKIYDYAEWCFRQDEEKLWNAAAVSFYEHLGDEPDTFQQFTAWVKRDIYLDIRGLLYLRIRDEQLKALDAFYRVKSESS